jgi:hypothetical protein
MSYAFDDEEDIEYLKYKIGDADIRIPNIDEYTLLFAFDYLSLNSTRYCFNNPSILAEDFIKIYEFKKLASKITIRDFTEKDFIRRQYHFHHIDIFHKKFLQELFTSLLGRKIDINKLPSLYQFAIFTDNNTLKAPRIIGFFGKRGVFHVLWLDYEHAIYPMK